MARKAYLLAFSAAFGTNATVKELVEKLSTVLTWRYDMTNSYYLISEASAKEIGEEIRRLQPKGRFIVTEIPDNSWGWLTKQSWYLIQNLKHLPKTD